MKKHIGIIAVLAAGAIFVVEPPFAQSRPQQKEKKSGTVCVLPNSPERSTRISPGGDYNPDTLTVQIDKQEEVRWPHKDVVRIGGLDLHQRHLVVLTSDGKRIQSFWFRFSDYADEKLCMLFDGYQGVQLGDRRDALWCRVSRGCWR